MNRHHKKLLEILSFSLYSESRLSVSDSLLKSASWHDIIPFISNGNEAISIITNNVHVLREQDEICTLLNGLQYAIVGGSASAIYYANPIKKTLRNIEIIAKNPVELYNILVNNGYTASCSAETDVESIYFTKAGVAIVLHRRMNKIIIDSIDNVLCSNINTHSFRRLPDLFNGLVLLKEIERNPKLASVVDWITYVDCFLRDEQWNTFETYVEQIGLTDLAKVTARFGQIYLNLSKDIHWCLDASLKKVDKLADRIFCEDIDLLHKHKRRPFLHSVYRKILKSSFCKPAYYITDLEYVIRHYFISNTKIAEYDIKNVEDNVTFIFKSFNRQRQARRLYWCIKSYYPNAKIIIADDSKDPLDVEGVLHLPFNSGLGIGLVKALELVTTPFVMRLDDDMLLTSKTNIHGQLHFLQNHPEVDLVAVQANYKKPRESARRSSQMKMKKRLLIPAGTIIEGREVIYKAANVFLARTDKVRLVGYDSNIQRLDHYDFFYRAAGKIVCVQDPAAYVMHCHNRFDREYNKYRYDIKSDSIYINDKYS